MVKYTDNSIAGDIAKLNEHETSQVLDYSSTLLPARKSKSRDISQHDELIVSLSDAYENKRARQVFEWETVRRQNDRRAA